MKYQGLQEVESGLTGAPEHTHTHPIGASPFPGRAGSGLVGKDSSTKGTAGTFTSSSPDEDTQITGCSGALATGAASAHPETTKPCCIVT